MQSPEDDPISTSASKILLTASKNDENIQLLISDVCVLIVILFNSVGPASHTSITRWLSRVSIKSPKI